MYTSNYGKDDFSTTFFFGKSLFGGEVLSQLEELIFSSFPEWSSSLHAWVEGSSTPRREINDFPSDLARIVGGGQDSARDGDSKAIYSSREFRTVELRGGGKELTIVLAFSNEAFTKSSGRWLWGNSVAIQWRDKADVDENVKKVFRDWCSRLSPWYAYCCHEEERDRKNMSRKNGGMMAVGVDISRYLPALYWGNYFGEPYCRMMGLDRILASPSSQACACGDGAILFVDESACAWMEDGSSNGSVLSHIGAEYFFDKDNVDRDTVAPDFGLEVLKKFPRFS